ncbi:MAG: outer membrane lipoprotein carrier protein LolA [Porticoccus sp.]|nr:outer membrane lipoprotein carrier protein LolA [Porticoccus sp.]MBQ0807568.1 outer membrane lipoprotein carrier protein LolA [Porticoccus sp.]
MAGNGLQAEVASRVQAVKSLSGSFKQQRSISVLPLLLLSEGSFEYTRANGMIWQTMAPVESIVTITSSGIDVGDGSSQTVGSAHVAAALLGVFSGRFDLLKEQFTIDAKGDAAEWQLELRPKSALVAEQIVSISISGRQAIDTVVVSEANGDTSSISLVTETITTDK